MSVSSRSFMSTRANPLATDSRLTSPTRTPAITTGVPIRLRGERDRAAVGVIHAVRLERARDDSRPGGRQRRERVIGAQPEVNAVRRRGGAAGRARAMRGRPYEAALDAIVGKDEPD